MPGDQGSCKAWEQNYRLTAERRREGIWHGTILARTSPCPKGHVEPFCPRAEKETAPHLLGFRPIAGERFALMGDPLVPIEWAAEIR
jgi:hypothetical protein